MTPPAAAASPSVRPGRPTRPASPHPARLRPAGPRTAVRRPRRVSGPARRPAQARRPVQAPEPLLYRLLGRLIDSRLWIGIVACSLIVIVAMQLWVLKLNAGIGRAITHEALLARENAALSAANAELSAGDRVEQLATSEEGMVIVPPGALRFLTPRGALDARMAAAALAHPVQAPAAASTPVPSEPTAGASSSEVSTPASGEQVSTGTSTEPQG